MEANSELLNMCHVARFVIQKPSLTILPINKIQSFDMRIHQGIIEKGRYNRKVEDEDYLNHDDSFVKKDFKSILPDSHWDVSQFQFLREVLKIRVNKGLNAEQKVFYMQGKLKELNSYKGKVIMSHNMDTSLRLSSGDFDRLRQESEAIKRLINVNLERKD